MRWQGRRESDNVEDRRGQSGSPFGGGGGGGFRLPSGKGGIVLLIIVLVAGYYGVDLTGMLTGEPMPQQQTSTQRSISPKDDEAAKFTSVILATTEDTWGPIFEKMGRQYPQPKLVLYRGATRTGCGTGQSVMGPFYCPADSTVYIDLSFYDEMKNKLGADGDFAQGYVIAHEVGHHVQKLLGIEPKVRQQQQHATQAEANRLSVKMELQADCFAGVWGHNAAAGYSGNWRSAGGAERRRGHRRRSSTAAEPGTRGAGQFYPRHLETALHLVQTRFR